jgi:hypothetical protein
MTPFASSRRQCSSYKRLVVWRKASRVAISARCWVPLRGAIKIRWVSCTVPTSKNYKSGRRRWNELSLSWKVNKTKNCLSLMASWAVPYWTRGKSVNCSRTRNGFTSRWNNWSRNAIRWCRITRWRKRKTVKVGRPRWTKWRSAFVNKKRNSIINIVLIIVQLWFSSMRRKGQSGIWRRIIWCSNDVTCRTKCSVWRRRRNYYCARTRRWRITRRASGSMGTRIRRTWAWTVVSLVTWLSGSWVIRRRFRCLIRLLDRLLWWIRLNC